MASWDIDGGDLHLKSLELPLNHSAHDDKTTDTVVQELKYPKPFSVKILCAAIQKDCSLATIKTYLSSYVNTDGFTQAMSETGWPELYYAVERNSADLVSILLRYKADPHWSCKTFPVPLIAFAIIHGHREALDTTDVVRALLAFGVDPKTIPMDMWEVYLETPKQISSSNSGLSVLYDNSSTSEYFWCTGEVRRLLAESFHLTQRYSFWVAHRMTKPNIRIRQVAEGNKISDLLKLPFFLVGQRPAAKMVQTKVFSYIAGKGNRPLVMAFDGPSGHGKTELARVMGDLLSVKTQVIDCAKAPFTGRVGSIIPFLPFSEPEVAVVAHKLLLNLATRIRQPINLQEGIDRYIGHCRLKLLEDGNVCGELARIYYNQHTRARSMENAVDWVEENINEEYILLEAPIEKKLNEGPLQEIVVQRICIGDDKYEIKVDARMPETNDTVPLMDVMYSHDWQTSEMKEKKKKNDTMT